MPGADPRHARRSWRRWRSSNDPDLSAIGSALTIALKAFEEATSWMLAHYDSSPREAAAGAVPYLKLTGTVTGGWQMARAARIAHRSAGVRRGERRVPAGQDRHGALLRRACAAGGGAVAVTKSRWAPARRWRWRRRCFRQLALCAAFAPHPTMECGADNMLSETRSSAMPQSASSNPHGQLIAAAEDDGVWQRGRYSGAGVGFTQNPATWGSEAMLAVIAGWRLAAAA